MILFQELKAYTNKTSLIYLIYHIFLNAGFQANILYRIAHFFHKHKLKIIAKCFQRFNLFLTGADIASGAKIGKRLFLPHPNGIVIGDTTKIGNDCIILQGVTLGAKKIRDSSNNRHPTLLNNVQVGANACIIGNITIGSNSKIAPNSLVLKSLDEDSIFLK